MIQRFRLDGRFVCEVPTALDHDDVSRPEGHAIYVKDPDGHQIEIVEYRADYALR